MTTTKTCTKCGTTKPLSEFHTHKYGRDGTESICKACKSADGIARYHANKAKAKPKPAPAIAPPTNNGCEPFVTNVPRLQKERWNLPAAGYQPLTMRDLPQPVLRPGADDHKKHGSLQADGSVQPYRKPRCEPSYYQPQALQPRLNNGKFSNG